MCSKITHLDYISRKSPESVYSQTDPAKLLDALACLHEPICKSRGEALPVTNFREPIFLQVILKTTVLAIALICGACSSGKDEARKRITPEYDKGGKLSLLKYDSDGDGKIDTWSYMDGARVVRIEIDKDEDGKIDRWEYYGPDQKLQKVGLSRQNDGKEDAWTYFDADGAVARVEISTHSDGKINRVEFYEHGVMVRAQEDTDGDGKIDKWETYDGARLASVAFDTTHRGTPDRRLTYGPNGTAQMEVDKKGDGHFTPVRN